MELIDKIEEDLRKELKEIEDRVSDLHPNTKAKAFSTGCAAGIRQALLTIQKYKPVELIASEEAKNWPPNPWHCAHKNSCMRYQQCMYMGCFHNQTPIRETK